MFRRVAAFILGLSLVIAPVPPVSADAPYMGGGHTYIRSHTVTPAALMNYTVNTLGHASAGRGEEHILSYTPNPGLRGFVAAPETVRSEGMTIGEAAEKLRARGYDVVCGINGGFFNGDMTPIGLLINDGILTSFSPEKYPAVGFTPDGGTLLGEPNITITVSSEYGTVDIDRLNKTRNPGFVYMYTRDFSQTTRTTMQGVHTVIKAEGALTPGGALTGTVVKVLSGKEAYEIGAGELVLSATSEDAIERFAFLREGDTVTVTTSCSDPRWEGVTAAVSGLNTLVRDGLPLDVSDGIRAPRTAVGVTEWGEVIFYTIDGRQSGYSIGLSLGELAGRMAELGCVFAFNMDGGGSTAMSVRMPGETPVKTVNRPSDGKERKCADFIFLCNVLPQTDGTPAYLFPQPAYLSMMPGSTAGFTFLATDSAYRPVAPPQGTVTAVNTEGLPGQAQGAWFTAHYPGEALLSFALSGAAGTAKVTVVSEIDALTVTDPETNGTVTSLNLLPGQEFKMAASASLSDVPLFFNVYAFTWSLEGDIGTVSREGVFTASTEKGGAGLLTVSALNKTVTIPVWVGNEPSIVISEPEDREGVRSYQLTVTDAGGKLPKEVSVLWDGENPGAIDWDTETGRALITVPLPATGFHILSVSAADAGGKRARLVSADYLGRTDMPGQISDTDNKWYTGYIDFLDSRNILTTETVDGMRYFRPSGDITRLEAMLMIYRILRPDPQSFTGGTLPFADVGNLTEEEITAVKAVYAAGIISGKPGPDGSLLLGPYNSMSHAEVFTILYNTLPKGYTEASLSDFDDGASVPNYAAPAVRTLVGMKVVQGSEGKLGLRPSMSRAEAASLFCRFFY